MTGGAAKGAVVRGLVYSGLKRTVHMAVGGGGACMTRRAQETGGERMGRGIQERFQKSVQTKYVSGARDCLSLAYVS